MWRFVYYTGLTQAPEIWKIWKIMKKSSMHDKLIDFEKKTKYSWKNHGIL